MRSTLKTNIAAVLAAAGMALAAPTVLAQSNVQGAIVGNVAKGSGAEVVIVSQDTGLTRTMTPDSEGRFAATALPTGRYTVTLKQAGQPDQAVDVLVTVGSNSVVRFDEMVMSEVVVTGERRIAAIDTSTVEANLQITAEELQELPVARSETAVALLAPGTTLGDYRFSSTNGGNSAGLASFAGSSVAENAYYVNGFNVTNFRNGLGGSTIPFEAYNDFQVKTGGYSAEFGRSTGGVVNTTTKRGTNQWKFGINAVTTFSDLEGSQKDSFYINEDGEKTIYEPFKRDERELTTANVEIGGPLWKDHLFIYGIYQFRDEKTTDWKPSERRVDVSDDPFWLAKVDWKITDSHLLEGTYWSDENNVVREIYAGADTLTNNKGESVGKTTFENGGENYVIKYTGFWTDTFTVSALYGDGKYARTTAGAGDLCPAVYDGRTNPALDYQGCWTSLQIGLQDDEREAYRLDFEWRLGDHQLRFGYDNENNKSADLTAYSGGIYYRYYPAVPGAGIPGGFSGTVPAGVDEIVRVRVYENGGNFEVKSEAYYLEDNWQITDDFLLSLGVRNETFENLNSLGDTFVKMDNQWAPRLGFAWDIAGDGSSKFYGNAGRYYLPVASNTNIRMAGGELFYAEAWTFTNIDTAGDWSPTLGTLLDRTDYSDGSIKDPLTIVTKGLDPHYQDEFILGYQWQMNDLWSFGIKGVYREVQSTLEDLTADVALNEYADSLGIGCGSAVDFCAGGNDFYVLANPGSPVTISVDFGDGNGLTQVTLDPESLRYPEARRTYKAIELTADRAFDDKWFMRASYVWAESKGNSEGYVKSDNGQDDAGLTQDFDHWGLAEYSYGKLPNNREHTFKIYGLYQLTPEWRFSTNIFAQSGRPRNCFGVHPTDPDSAGYGASSFYCNGGEPVPRGTAGTTPWIYNVDLGVEWRPAFADDNLSVKLDVFNVFNFQDATYLSEVGEIGFGQPDPTYGAIERYQRPLTVRLGLSYNFGL